MNSFNFKIIKTLIILFSILFSIYYLISNIRKGFIGEESLENRLEVVLEDIEVRDDYDIVNLKVEDNLFFKATIKIKDGEIITNLKKNSVNYKINNGMISCQINSSSFKYDTTRKLLYIESIMDLRQ